MTDIHHAGEGAAESRGVAPNGTPLAQGVCQAPLVAMDFDPIGNVQACCANALYPLGNIAENSLREIWEGARAQLLRSALARGNLNLGCGVCRYRIVEAGGGVPRDYYDQFAVDEPVPQWPQLLAFSLHNTCNLACVMCGGDASSRIRTQRDGLPGLPHRYGDEFFEQIIPFLENCRAMDFVGGEPFLVREHHRIWEQLATLGRRLPISVTTNGTVWNERVEWVLDTFPTNICVSFDGTSAETFEGMRVGAEYLEVRENLDRFAAYTAGAGTALTLSFSLTRHNWQEMGSVLLLAEDLGADVTVQTVIEPDHGVQRLPTDSLSEAVASLDAQSETIRHSLVRTGATWDRELARLHAELERRSAGRPRILVMEPPAEGHAQHVTDFARATTTPRSDRPAVRSAAESGLRAWSQTGRVGRWRLDRSGRVATAPEPGSDPLGEIGIDAGPMVGETLVTVVDRVAARLGARLWVAEEFHEPDRSEQTLWFGRDVRDKAGLIMRWTTVGRGRSGHDVFYAVDARFLPDSAVGSSPVALTSRQKVT